MSTSNPYLLDWGSISVDSFNTITKNATTVFNFNFEMDGHHDNIFNYSIGYIYWVHKNIPAKSTITIIYDVRGLTINLKDLKQFEKKLKTHLVGLNKSIKANLIFRQ